MTDPKLTPKEQAELEAKRAAAEIEASVQTARRQLRELGVPTVQAIHMVDEKVLGVEDPREVERLCRAVVSAEEERRSGGQEEAKR